MTEALELKETEFLEIASYIETHYGINLEEKRMLMKNRLLNMISKSEHQSFGDFFKAACQDSSGKLMMQIIERLTTNHTFFNREIDHFNLLKEALLPQVLSDFSSSKEKEIRIWSAGCSSGEEPYTLAILMTEFLKQYPEWRFDILATDISTQVLEKAKEGIYPTEALSTQFTQYELSRYFIQNSSELMQIRDTIKNRILFKHLNLARSEFPFKQPFHIIFCRNVMIYFKDEFKLRLVNKFYNHTAKQGYLFIGHSETLPRHLNPYSFLYPTVFINNGGLA